MKKIFILITFLFFFASQVQAADLSEELAGRILLQVEANGEAWYINPVDQKRYYLGRPIDAFNMMRELGIGISNQDLSKIPVNFDYVKGQDSDNDGLADTLEEALGTDKNLMDSDGDSFNDREELLSSYNPLGDGDLYFDDNFAFQQAGKIFLQVEKNGEAWYVSPVTRQRYFLGRPDDAFNVMRGLGLGVSNNDLDTIPSKTASYNASDLEIKMFESINQERLSAGRKALIWNDELAAVAREHSEDLALENSEFVGEGYSCEFPLIHHEGLEFGIYNSERLKNRGIYYYSMTGENIALVPTISTTALFKVGDVKQQYFDSCPERRDKMEEEFKEKLDEAEDDEAKIEIIKAEDLKRAAAFQNEFELKIEKQEWLLSDKVISETVEGWMNSPGHKANILETEFDESGIGVASVDGYLISTQVFIERADCAYQGGPCCVEEGYYPYCFTGLSCEDMICS